MSSHMKPCARCWCFLLDKWEHHKNLDREVSFYKRMGLDRKKSVGQRQQKETSLLPVNRHVRSVEDTWLVFTCLERLRTILPSLNLYDGCTYLPDPRTDLGEGESMKESLAFPIDASKRSMVVCCGCSCTAAGYKLWLYPAQRHYNCPHRAGRVTGKKRGVVLQICGL